MLKYFSNIRFSIIKKKKTKSNKNGKGEIIDMIDKILNKI